MRRSFLTLVIASIAALWGTALMAQGIPQGSYQQTCNNISVNGGSLVASCQDTQGNWHETSLPGFQSCTSGIINDNGTLRCEVSGYSAPAGNGYGPSGSYLQTCQDVHVKGNDLHARCRAADGDWHNAKLDNYNSCSGDIANDDGHLRCISGGPVGAYGPGPYARRPGVYGRGPYGGPGPYSNVNGPAGSYAQTCTNVRVGGDDLHARCQAQDGSWHDAKLDDFNKCRGDIVNDNGQLRCVAGAPVGAYGPGPYNPPGRYVGANGPNGSYTQTCMDIHVDGDDLKARCQTRDGDVRDTKLDNFRNCQSDIINDNGQLRCQK